MYVTVCHAVLSVLEGKYSQYIPGRIIVVRGRKGLVKAKVAVVLHPVPGDLLRCVTPSICEALVLDAHVSCLGS